MKNFKHSGQSGDLIFSLAAIKSYNEESNLYLNLNVKANLYPGAKNPLGDVYLNQKMFDFMYPLLSEQDYLKDVKVLNGQKIDVDLDEFRTVPLNPAMGSLVKRYFYFIHNFIDLTKPWITSNKIYEDLNDKILICRSERYRNETINYAYLRNFNNIVFCGLDDEWYDFRKWVPNAERIVAEDSSQLAGYINSCKFFIGNQSLSFSIAEALKKDRLLEVNFFAPNNISAGGKCNDFLNQKSFQNFVNLYNN
jgi:hypothetical protein